MVAVSSLLNEATMVGDIIDFFKNPNSSTKCYEKPIEKLFVFLIGFFGSVI